MITVNKPQETTDKKVTWLKRGGIAVFLFFLLKGLVWLGIFAAAWFGLTK